MVKGIEWEIKFLLYTVISHYENFKTLTNLTTNAAHYL